ncbi:hypothetical protein ILUMI_02211 [Ignelater luminosus]|uniref:Uncharacterized protein n=1 Tax=Ignelater luminosus TaxID=2038154 RepID=A0A8K0DGX5_IGNLU|nr:hypothetical protein ILUMI_02211 [Ignelater luminosus]
MEDVPRLNPYYDTRRHFSDQQETTLCDYLQTCANLNHGLPPKAARSLAYELAVTNNIQVPDSCEFLALSVTDIAPNKTTATNLTLVITNTSLDAPSTSSSIAPANNCYERSVTPPRQFIPPHVIQPYPNVKRNVDIRKGRKRRSTQVVTDTPIQNELAEIENAKIAKKMKQSVKRNLSKPTKEKKSPNFRNSETVTMICQLKVKKQRPVKKILQDELTIIFLRRKKDKFVYPAVEDVATADKDDIVLVLPKPLNTGGTARINSYLKFPTDFDAYNVC